MSSKYADNRCESVKKQDDYFQQLYDDSDTQNRLFGVFFRHPYLPFGIVTVKL